MKFSKINFKNREASMHDRFIFRVLLPPFVLLVLIGGIGYWQLNNFLRTQAINDLQSAAETTSIRLEREIAIRETVLKNTGEEISDIKATYISSIETLDNNRASCREHYLLRFTFNNSPEDSCDIFSQGFTRPSLETIEDIFIKEASSYQATEIEGVNQRLSAYKQFFPETLAVLVIDEDNQVVSSAVSGDIGIEVSQLSEIANRASSSSIEGEILSTENYKLAIFAFPNTDGSVLAAYDVNNANYIRPAWLNTPINNEEALALIVDGSRNIVYPGVKNESQILANADRIEDGSSKKVKLGDVENIISAKSIDNSNWSVIVASPEAVVFAPVRDAQFIALIFAGIFVIGFLWVGTFFIKKTTDSIAQLVTGAMVYGSGRLDYKLNIDNSEKEFKQLADTMYYMAQRIAKSEKENDERNKEFISIATHELRAPMTSIIGYLSILQENIEKKLNKQDKMLLSTAYDGTIRLRDLVNDMLDAARLEGGREEFNLKAVNISGFITDCIDSMKVVANQEKVSVTYDAKGADKVYADEGKLRIILNNFVSNAIKYNHKSGRVHISHSHHDGQLVTAISNSGPSIPDNQQEHMFEKFFRVDTPEHRKVTGTGIGMFVTKQYVEVMNGKVWFTSKPNEDTIFYFSLPVAGSGKLQKQAKTTTPTLDNSKWIMRWRKRLK